MNQMLVKATVVGDMLANGVEKKPTRSDWFALMRPCVNGFVSFRFVCVRFVTWYRAETKRNETRCKRIH